jgi:hypothetical protein
MATYYEKGSRTKDGKGKSRDCNERFGEQYSPPYPALQNFSILPKNFSRIFFIAFTKICVFHVLYTRVEYYKDLKVCPIYLHMYLSP